MFCVSGMSMGVKKCKRQSEGGTLALAAIIIREIWRFARVKSNLIHPFVQFVELIEGSELITLRMPFYRDPGPLVGGSIDIYFGIDQGGSLVNPGKTEMMVR